MPHRLCRTCTASLQVHALCLLQPRPLLPQRTRRRLPEVQEQPGSVGSMRMTPQVQRGVAGGLGRRATLLQGRVVTGLPATTEHWPCKRRIRAGPHRKANTVKRGWGSGNAGSANWLNCQPCCTPAPTFPLPPGTPCLRVRVGHNSADSSGDLDFVRSGVDVRLACATHLQGDIAGHANQPQLCLAEHEWWKSSVWMVCLSSCYGRTCGRIDWAGHASCPTTPHCRCSVGNPCT